MKIVIIGTGNVAYHLAKAFTEKHLPLLGIYGRNQQELEFFKEKLSVNIFSELPKADFYLICVKDNAIAEVSAQITNTEAVVAHTSGSNPKEILIGNYRKACLYPLQTFSKTKNLDYSQIPFFIEAENAKDEQFLKDITGQISDKIMLANFEKRKYIHLTAVFTCNFVNHLFTRGKEISDSQNIPYNFFFPLIEETIQKIKYIEPKIAQTGPAVRNDTKVLQLQESLLKGTPKQIYALMSKSIMEMF